MYIVLVKITVSLTLRISQGNNEWRDDWKQYIVNESGEHFKGKGGDHLGDEHKHQVMEGKSRNAATTSKVATVKASTSPSAAAVAAGDARPLLPRNVDINLIRHTLVA